MCKKRAPICLADPLIYTFAIFYQAQMQYTSIANFPLNTWSPKVIYPGAFSIARIWLDLWYKDQNSPFCKVSVFVFLNFNLKQKHSLYKKCWPCSFHTESILWKKSLHKKTAIVNHLLYSKSRE